MKKNQDLMIYRIYNYEERYGFSAVRTDRHKDRKDSFEERPPLFVKKYIGQGHDDDTINLCKQMKMLKSCENYDMLNTVYDELLACAAFQVKWSRGYLFDGMKRPASIQSIALIIERPLPQLISAMDTLIEIGLIEKVRVADVWQTCGKAAAKKWQALINNGNGIISSEKRLTDNGRTSKRKTTDKSRKGKAEAENKSRSRKQKPKPKQSKTTQSTANQQGQGAKQTAEPKPNEPTQTELSQESRQPQGEPTAPGKSDKPLIRTDEDFERFARTLAPIESKFADEVYDALRCQQAHGDRHKTPGVREYVTFVEAMRRAVMAGLTVHALTALSESMVKEARRLGRQRFTKHWTKSCEACWMNIFNKKLMAYRGQKARSLSSP